MRVIYKRLFVLVVVLMLSLGSWAVWKPISESTAPNLAWIAWFIVVFVTAIAFYGNYYIAFLQGVNEIARIQRWQMWLALAAIISSSLVLFLGGNLLAVVISYQLWGIVTFFVNRWLKNTVHDGRGKAISDARQISPHVWEAVWPAAWRSAIGVIMSVGLIQLSGVVYAQVGETAKVASYLLGLQIIR